MRRVFLITVFAACLPPVSGQCTGSYSDGDVDADGTALIGWSSVTDYYNQSQCTPGWGDFTHDYVAQIAVQSPSGRLATGYISSSQYGGGGSAYTSTSLPIFDELGDYYLQDNNQINCSVAGLILVTSVRRPYFAVGRARATYGFDSPFGGCSYHKSCSPFTNHWAGDQYTSMGFNRPPDYTSCWNFISKFHRFVKAGNFRRYWPTTDDMGRSYWGHDEWLECDGPLP